MNPRNVLVGLLALLGLGLIGAFVAVEPMQARAVITVTTIADEYGSGAGCSLREAIFAVATDSAFGGCPAGSGADTIILPAGIYTLTIPGANEDAGMMGDLDIGTDLTISGAGADVTIIDGNGLDRVVDTGTFNLTISGVQVQGGVNTATTLGFGGGGIRKSAGGVLTLVNSVVFSNTSYQGGGIYNSTSGQLNIVNSAIVSNTSPNCSGGIYSDSSLTIISSTISSNVGRGVFNYQGVLTLTASTVEGNTGCSGAGVASDNGTTLITNSTIKDNHSIGIFEPGGGGLYITRGVMTVTNSTISGNSADVSGGGIYNFPFGLNNGQVYLYNVTLANNTADSDLDGFGNGGGIGNGGFVYSRNSLLGGNVDTGGEAPDFSGTLISQGYNLIQSTIGYTITGILMGNLIGVDPLLGPLQNNGGSTLTHALLLGSPAIDTGDPTGCVDHLGNLLAADQRGEPRPVDGDGDTSVICDIGAYEAGAGSPTAIPSSTATATDLPGTTATPTLTLTPVVTYTPTPVFTFTPTSTPSPTPVGPGGSKLYLPLIMRSP